MGLEKEGIQEKWSTKICCQYVVVHLKKHQSIAVFSSTVKNDVCNLESLQPTRKSKGGRG